MRDKFIKIIFLFLGALFLISGCDRWAGQTVKGVKAPISKVCWRDNCFKVELAETPAKRELGLSGRKYLEKYGGMLFIFPDSGRYSFWMKNTLIPLDIIWINKQKEAVFIAEETRPCRDSDPCGAINPNQEAIYVLEVNAGMAEVIGLKIGDKISFE